MVVQHNKVDKKVVKRSVAALQKASPNVLGVVLNQVDVQQKGYYYYYYQHDAAAGGRRGGARRRNADTAAPAASGPHLRRVRAHPRAFTGCRALVALVRPPSDRRRPSRRDPSVPDVLPPSSGSSAAKATEAGGPSGGAARHLRHGVEKAEGERAPSRA